MIEPVKNPVLQAELFKTFLVLIKNFHKIPSFIFRPLFNLDYSETKKRLNPADYKTEKALGHE